METKRFSFPVILGSLIAVVGVIAPMVWDLYKTKNSLELQHLSTITLLEKSPAIDKLKILYNNNEIESLSKIRFALVNTGRTPITRKDLISLPTLTFLGEVSLLEVKAERLSPENLEFYPEIDNATQTVNLSFTLLNPSDVIEFSILLSGHLSEYNAKARIIGIKELKIVDRAKELEKQPKRISWTIYPVSIVTLFFVIIFLILLNDATKEAKIRKRYLLREAELPKYTNKSDYLQFISRELSYIQSKDKLKLELFLKEYADALNDENQKQITNKIIEIISSRSGAMPGAVMVLMLILISFLYVLLKIL